MANGQDTITVQAPIDGDIVELEIPIVGDITPGTKDLGILKVLESYVEEISETSRKILEGLECDFIVTYENASYRASEDVDDAIMLGQVLYFDLDTKGFVSHVPPLLHPYLALTLTGATYNEDIDTQFNLLGLRLYVAGSPKKIMPYEEITVIAELDAFNVDFGYYIEHIPESGEQDISKIPKVEVAMVTPLYQLDKDSGDENEWHILSTISYPIDNDVFTLLLNPPGVSTVFDISNIHTLSEDYKFRIWSKPPINDNVSHFGWEILEGAQNIDWMPDLKITRHGVGEIFIQETPLEFDLIVISTENLVVLELKAKSMKLSMIPAFSLRREVESHVLTLTNAHKEFTLKIYNISGEGIPGSTRSVNQISYEKWDVAWGHKEEDDPLGIHITSENSNVEINEIVMDKESFLTIGFVQDEGENVDFTQIGINSNPIESFNPMSPERIRGGQIGEFNVTTTDDEGNTRQLILRDLSYLYFRSVDTSTLESIPNPQMSFSIIAIYTNRGSGELDFRVMRTILGLNITFLKMIGDKIQSHNIYYCDSFSYDNPGMVYVNPGMVLDVSAHLERDGFIEITSPLVKEMVKSTIKGIEDAQDINIKGLPGRNYTERVLRLDYKSDSKIKYEVLFGNEPFTIEASEEIYDIKGDVDINNLAGELNEGEAKVITGMDVDIEWSIPWWVWLLSIAFYFPFLTLLISECFGAFDWNLDLGIGDKDKPITFKILHKKKLY